MAIKLKTGSATGPASYSPAARPTISITEMSAINSLNDVVNVVVTGGYVGEATVISGNTVTVKIYEQQVSGASGAVAALVEVTSGTNLSASTIRISARGY